MRNLVSILFLCFLSSYNYAQSLDLCIKTLANDLGSKVSRKTRTQLALADFVNESGKSDALTDYIHEQLETDLINADNLKVMDRKHITQILAEHHLQSQGLIDETTARSAISFIKVDGWVLGEVVHFGHKIKIKLKVIDIATSQLFAASESELIQDDLITTLLQPKACNYCGGTGKIKAFVTCNACNGNKGSKVCSNCGGKELWDMSVYPMKKVVCPVCSGSGFTKCNSCKGSGQMEVFDVCLKCKGSGKVL
jgi:TolB-like protein